MKNIFENTIRKIILRKRQFLSFLFVFEKIFCFCFLFSFCFSFKTEAIASSKRSEFQSFKWKTSNNNSQSNSTNILLFVVKARRLIYYHSTIVDNNFVRTFYRKYEGKETYPLAASSVTFSQNPSVDLCFDLVYDLQVLLEPPACGSRMFQTKVLDIS